MSDLLLLDPVPLPDGLDIPVEDWHQTPTSVRHQVLALLKRVDALEARFHPARHAGLVDAGAVTRLQH